MYFKSNNDDILIIEISRYQEWLPDSSILSWLISGHFLLSPILLNHCWTRFIKPVQGECISLRDFKTVFLSGIIQFIINGSCLVPWLMSHQLLRNRLLYHFTGSSSIRWQGGPHYQGAMVAALWVRTWYGFRWLMVSLWAALAYPRTLEVKVGLGWQHAAWFVHLCTISRHSRFSFDKCLRFDRHTRLT